MAAFLNERSVIVINNQLSCFKSRFLGLYHSPYNTNRLVINRAWIRHHSRTGLGESLTFTCTNRTDEVTVIFENAYVISINKQIAYIFCSQN
jgi:hypothetical protein